MKTSKKIILIILIVIFAVALNFFLWNYVTSYNKIFMTVTSLFFLVLFILTIVLWRSTETIVNNSTLNISDYYKISNAKELWKISSIIWASIYYFLSGLSILSSIVIIYISSSKVGKEEDVIFYSVLAIFFSIIVFILHPMEIAIGYRSAFKKMNICMLKFSNKMIDFKEVIKTLEECEDLIIL